MGDVGWPIPQGIGDVMGDSLDAAGAEALRPAQVRPFAGYACWASMLINKLNHATIETACWPTLANVCERCRSVLRASIGSNATSGRTVKPGAAARSRQSCGSRGARSARSAEQRCRGKHCVACLVNHRFVGDLLESILFDRKLNHPSNMLCAITCAVERG